MCSWAGRWSQADKRTPGTATTGVDRDPGDPHGARRPSPASVALLVVLFLGIAVVLHLPGFSDQVFNSDEAYLATQAQVLNDGGRLYVDTVDRKPPVVPYLYAAVFRVTGSDDLGPVRFVAVLAQVATALLLAYEARRRFGWRYAPLVAGHRVPARRRAPSLLPTRRRRTSRSSCCR